MVVWLKRRARINTVQARRVQVASIRRGSIAVAAAMMLFATPLVAWSGSRSAATTQAAPACSTGRYSLLVSTTPDRANPSPVCGQDLSGNVYVFLSPASGPKKVQFFLDGALRQVENNAPWDFAGGDAQAPRSWNASSVSPGSHTIAAEVSEGGGSTTAFADFTVGGSSTPPPPPNQACSGVAIAAGADLSAITRSKPAGTTFCLSPGTYNVRDDVELEDGDRLIGAGRNKTFAVGAGGAEHLFSSRPQADWLVASMDISGGSGDGSCNPDCGRAFVATGNSLVVRDIRCHDNANQCIGGGRAAVTMLDSECDNNGFGAAFLASDKRSAACIKRAGSGNGQLLVRGSYIHDNGWAGVWCDHCEEGPFIVEDNVIEHNGSKGVSYEVSGGFSSTDSAIIRDNTIRYNGFGDDRTVAAGITCNSCAQITIQGNVFGGNSDGLAIVLEDRSRGPWGSLYGVVIKSNTMNKDIVKGCEFPGVNC